LVVHHSERKRVNSASFLDWIEVPNNVFDRCLFRVIERAWACCFVTSSEQLRSGCVLTVSSGTLTLSGKMQSFADFLVAIITLCLFTQEDLMRFLFNAFDVDDSGAIDEVGTLLHSTSTSETENSPDIGVVFRLIRQSSGRC
jgi:hypothetical protein